jgi:hypothetical protein|tara:strand:- start:91 stop:351 length:261 start_codon:yes stop_codon:yes gene_type:complete
MMKADEELIHYLRDSLISVNKLVAEAGLRNKTKKFKAINSLLVLTRDKLNATLKYARAGGYEELSVVTQQHLYTPVIEWLSGEVSF